MSENPFVLPSSAYKRDLSVLKTYVQDTAAYMAKMSGRPLHECIQFVKTALAPGGQFAFTDPEVVYLEREENGDRTQRTSTFSRYLKEALQDHDLIAPTFTTYVNPKVNQSLLVNFIDSNVKARGTAKHEMFAARRAGDKQREAIKKIEQTGKKLNNNALSGAHVSVSTPLNNNTAHSTLTSTCRSTSGYGNANNEKFLCGNRHYWSVDIVRNNIISILTHSDYAQIEAAMVQFGIRAPTVKETCDCITYSVDLYWRGKKDVERLFQLVRNMNDLERAAFVYTGDLYHLAKHNDEVVRTFITRLSSRIDVIHPNPAEVFKSVSDDVRNLAAQICAADIKQVAKKNVTGVFDVEGTPAFGICASTAQNIQQTLHEYSSLIKALWITPNLPASVSHFPDSIRRSAITSDTDSTIFTVQDWVSWHQHGLRFHAEAQAVAATMIFLASQTITHVLARMSANFGIEESRIHQIAMKNEFYFPVFVPTNVAKHYYALIGVQEGNVFKESDQEIKGVHLKSSNAPRQVMEQAKKMMEFIMTSVVQEKKISITYILKWIGDIERGIVESIQKGSHEYFRRGQVKTADSYIEKEEAPPWQQWLLWKEVFAPKYGQMSPPPYMSIKLSVDLSSPAKTKEWLDSLEDRELAARAVDWMERYGKKQIGTTFMLPEPMVAGRGIPPEIMNIVGVRKIVLDTTKVFYIILETLGMYMLNNKNTRLVSDQY